MRKIEIQNETIGSLTWEIPESLNDFLTENSRLSEQHKQVIDATMENTKRMIKSFLHLITGVLLAPRIVPTILPKAEGFIQMLLEQSAAAIKEKE